MITTMTTFHPGVRVLHDDNLASEALEHAKAVCVAAFHKWDDYSRYGALDMCHTDGYRMNVERDTFLSQQNWIRMICAARCWPEPDCCAWQVPEKADYRYMADADNLEKLGRKLWEEIQSSRPYSVMSEAVPRLEKLGKEKIHSYHQAVMTLRAGVEQNNAFLLQCALYDSVLSAGNRPPANAEAFLSRLTVVLSQLDEDDYQAQQRLYYY